MTAKPGPKSTVETTSTNGSGKETAPAPDIYVGIDPGAKNCALVAWSPTEGLITTWKPKGKMPTGVLRLRKLNWDISSELIKLAKVGRICCIAMEGYSMYEKYGQHASGEVGGVIKLTILTHFAARSDRAYPVLVPPQKLKKFVSGNGNTKKEMIPKEVFKRWDADFDDTNIAEAYALARLAHAIDAPLPELGPYQLPKFQEDVIKSLEGHTERPTDMPRRRLVRVGGQGAARASA